jgi:hypothetical protein
MLVSTTWYNQEGRINFYLGNAWCYHYLWYRPSLNCRKFKRRSYMVRAYSIDPWFMAGHKSAIEIIENWSVSRISRFFNHHKGRPQSRSNAPFHTKWAPNSLLPVCLPPPLSSSPYWQDTSPRSLDMPIVPQPWAFAHVYYRRQEQQRLRDARNEVVTSSQQTSHTRQGLDKDIDKP